MEIVSVKFKQEILEKIDSTITEHNFNSRTEFIREAVRDKMESFSRDELLKEFLKFRGKSPIKTTGKEREKIRKQASKELIEELDNRFS